MNTPNLVCSQCGQPQPAGQMYCSNCGGRIEPGPSAYGTPPNSGYGQPPMVPTQYASQPNAGQYGGYTNYNPADQAAPPPPPQGTSYGASSYPPTSNAYSPAPSAYQSAPGMYPPPGGGIAPFPQPPQQRKGPNVGLIVGLILLLVVVVGGGLFWAISRNSSGTTVQVTPTVSPSTPSPSPTPQALFTDNFSDNHNAWDVGPTGGLTVTLANGALKLKEINPSKMAREPFVQEPPSDALINVSFTFSSGGKNDAIGMFVRGSGQDHWYGYYVDVYGDNTYDIQRYYEDPSDSTKGKVDFLLEGTNTALNPKGQANEMSVVIKGSSISLTMNGKFIKTATDATNSFPAGNAYFFVETGDTSSGVEGTFNSVSMYPAPASLPS